MVYLQEASLVESLAITLIRSPESDAFPAIRGRPINAVQRLSASNVADPCRSLTWARISLINLTHDSV